MSQQNSLIPTFIIFIGAVIIIATILRGCDEKESEATVTEKIVYRDLPPAPALEGKADSVKIITKVIYKQVIDSIHEKVFDSIQVQRLLAQRDSLASILDTAISITFSTDTVHPVTHDTLSITCDDLKRQIEYSLRYAPRQEKIVMQTITQTQIKELSWLDKLYYTCGGFILNEIIHLFRK